jgi:hypothetical protein
MQFYPCQTQLSAPKFSSFSNLIIGFWFIQIDPQLLNKLLIFFSLAIDFTDSAPEAVRLYGLVHGFEFLQSSP